MIYPNKKYIEKLTGCNIIALKETPSTNDLAKKAAQNGAPDGTTYIAKIQTGGHGRGDKHFFCYDGGVYLSVIIRNSLLPAELITSAAAAAVPRDPHGYLRACQYKMDKRSLSFRQKSMRHTCSARRRRICRRNRYKCKRNNFPRRPASDRRRDMLGYGPEFSCGRYNKSAPPRSK